MIERNRALCGFLSFMVLGNKRYGLFILRVLQPELFEHLLEPLATALEILVHLWSRQSVQLDHRHHVSENRDIQHAEVVQVDPKPAPVVASCKDGGDGLDLATIARFRELKKTFERRNANLADLVGVSLLMRNLHPKWVMVQFG